jgi:histidyl-tRNA synthetase
MVEEFGGPPMGAVGFAIGMEATLLAIQNTRGGATQVAAPSPTDVYVICIGSESRLYGFGVLDALRKKGVAADGDYEARSPKAQMRTANKLGVRFAVVVGSDEVAQGVVTVKTMSTGEEAKLPLAEGVEFIVTKLKSAAS